MSIMIIIVIIIMIIIVIVITGVTSRPTRGSPVYTEYRH